MSDRGTTVVLGLTTLVGTAMIGVIIDPATAATAAGIATLGISLVARRFLLLLRTGVTLVAIGLAMPLISGPGLWGWAKHPWFWIIAAAIAVLWLLPIRIRVQPHQEDVLDRPRPASRRRTN